MSKIDLFLVALDEATTPTEVLTGWLDAEERTRLAEFSRPTPRRRYVVAHAALRLILGRIIGCHPSRIAFQKNAWGRPEIKAAPSFNMSHSGSFALIAAGEPEQIGVDIETSDRHVAAEVCAAVMSDAERCEMAERKMEKAERLRLWVRKEAVLKALGRGLAFAPRRLTIGARRADADHWRRAHLEDENGPRFFSLIDLRLPVRLIGALATDAAFGEAEKIELHPLTL